MSEEEPYRCARCGTVEDVGFYSDADWEGFNDGWYEFRSCKKCWKEAIAALHKFYGKEMP